MQGPFWAGKHEFLLFNAKSRNLESGSTPRGFMQINGCSSSSSWILHRSKQARIILQCKTHDHCLLFSLRSCKSLRKAMPVMTNFLKFSLKRPVARDPALRLSGIDDAEDMMGEI